MRPQNIIKKKRDGRALTRGEIGSFIDGVCSGGWADYQISALVMAMFIRGLDGREQHALTQAMLDSGEVLDFSDIDGPKADKHSTGGVGDKTSLIIAPLAAACGVAVPMISGRALGHTGGTLDKLESIPGYNVHLSLARMKKIIKACGFALAGQTDKFVPADKKLYALRDATATVPHIPLIVASVMSKKLAEGLDALVLDVKTGSGAFMSKERDSRQLARALVATGNNAKVRTQAIISDMSQPLGKFVGNSLEVFECIKIMRGEADEQMKPTLELSLELTARMLVLCGIEKSLAGARRRAKSALDSGTALEKFRQNIELQGGNSKVVDSPDLLRKGKVIEIAIKSIQSGYVSGIDARVIGECVVMIGGGRMNAEDKVDHSVGYSCEAKVGDKIRRGEVLGILHARKNAADAISQKLQNAYKISDKPTRKRKLIRRIV